MQQRETVETDDLMDYAFGGDNVETDDTTPTPQTAPEGNGAESDNRDEDGDGTQLELFGPDGDRRERETPPQAPKQESGTPDPNAASNNQSLTPVGATGFFSNGNNDIVDKNGVVVAKAGAERRLFEQSANIQGQLRHKDQYIASLEKRVDHFTKNPPQSHLNQAVKSMGLAENEVTLGLQLTNMWKKNPLDAVSHMFAEARKMGYNDQQIGQAINSYNPATSGTAIRTAVDEAIRPLIQRTEQQQAPQNEAAQVRDEITRVFAKHDGAYLHEEPLANLLKSDPKLSLEQAVVALKEFTTKHGLDFMSPLGPQIEARRNAQQQRPQPVARPNTPDQPGRGATQQAAVGNVGKTVLAEPDEDWGSIVRSTMPGIRR